MCILVVFNNSTTILWIELWTSHLLGGFDYIFVVFDMNIVNWLASAMQILLILLPWIHYVFILRLLCNILWCFLPLWIFCVKRATEEVGGFGLHVINTTHMAKSISRLLIIDDKFVVNLYVYIRVLILWEVLRLLIRLKVNDTLGLVTLIHMDKFSSWLIDV